MYVRHDVHELVGHHAGRMHDQRDAPVFAHFTVAIADWTVECAQTWVVLGMVVSYNIAGNRQRRNIGVT